MIKYLFNDGFFLSYRILKPLGVDFFIAPTPEIDIEMIDVNIKLIPEDFDNISVPALLIWDNRYYNSDTSCKSNVVLP